MNKKIYISYCGLLVILLWLLCFPLFSSCDSVSNAFSYWEPGQYKEMKKENKRLEMERRMMEKNNW